MEIEKRAIWFDIRLIICQRGDGALSVRAFCPWIAVIPQSQRGTRSFWSLGFRSPISRGSVSVCPAWLTDIFNFWLRINSFQLFLLHTGQTETRSSGITMQQYGLHLFLLFYFTRHYPLKSLLITCDETLMLPGGGNREEESDTSFPALWSGENGGEDDSF